MIRTVEAMRKPLLVAILVLAIISGSFSASSAHLTTGDHIAYYPFRQNYFDKHVTGPVGYVFPGSGLFGSGATSWYQLGANNYAPFSAMPTSTIRGGTPFTKMWDPAKGNYWASDNPTIEGLEIEHAVKGDLILAFNVTRDQKTAWNTSRPTWRAVNFTLIEIMIPPEFTGISRSNVVPSFTNNYDCIDVGKENRESFVRGPFWTIVSINTDTKPFRIDQTTYDKMDDAPDSWLKQTNKPYGPFQFTPWKTFGNITFSLVADANGNYPDEWYYVRVNDVTSPTIAGAYHFKFRLLSSPELGDVYWPYQNWPIVVVKGEVDPAIITGTVRYGGWNTALYGQAVTLPGRVRAVGLADDPYTGRSTGRPVEARGYFDAAWAGHYEIEGVAPGVYDIYASAAGYPEIKIASNLRILKGQSYHADGYLIPGVQIKGSVFSKCGAGEVPWFNRGPEANIKIEIYRALEDAQSMMPGGDTSKAVSWSPYGQGNVNWGSMSFAWTLGSFQEDPTRVLWGVGPAQSWQVPTGSGGFTFQFGREGYYGAPADMDGHVPSLDWRADWRNGATWVSGLGPGTYYVRAWLHGYVQTELDGVSFMPITFTVPSIEWPGNVYLPFDLRLSSSVTKVAHFHDVPGTLMENPIGWGWSYKGTSGVGGPNYYRYLAAELVSSGKSNYRNPNGEPVHAWRVEPVPVSSRSWQTTIRGFRQLGLSNGWGRNYGIPAGLYTVKAYMWGYVEQVFEKVNIGLCGTSSFISDHLYRGARFNITIYSEDWQHPTTRKAWSFPYQPIYLQIMKEGTQLAPSWSQYVMPVTTQGYGNTSVPLWPYMWNNPRHMIRTHDGAAEVFGPDNYRCNFSAIPNYYNDYFGPSAYHGAVKGVHFRYYDGSEHRDYYFSWPGADGEGATLGDYPLSFETGTYELRALTYGYIQKKSVMVYATKGNATTDILIKLTQGAEFQVALKFKHESIFEGIPFDAHLRIRVLDDKNKLVAEYLTSDWWWQPQFEWTTNRTRYNWNLVPTTPANPNSLFDPAARVARSYWRLNYIPAGTNLVVVAIAGLPDLYRWVAGYSCDPCRATADIAWDRAIYAPYGIDGYPNYKAGWKVQVHLVPIFDYYPGHYYNPVEVSAPPLLYPTAAPNPFGSEAMLTGELYYTADMKPIYANHMGPYELRYDVTVPNTYLGGESSLIFELDRRGLVTGDVYGYTYCDEPRTVAWTLVRFMAADGTSFDHYTFDGRFIAWLDTGPYTISVVYWTPAKQEGYKVQTMPYHVSEGTVGSFNIYLEQSKIPIPEFPAATALLSSALAMSLFILRRKRRP